MIRRCRPKFSHRSFATTAGVIATLLLACQPEAAMAEKPPKAIFVIVDGIAADVLESVPTPNFDDISRTGGYTRSFVGGIAANSVTPRW